MRRSYGTGFAQNETWTLEPYYGTRGTYFADVNGDSAVDAIVVRDENVTVRRSGALISRNEFFSNESWTPDPYYGSRMNFFADATGDRVADAIVVNDDGVAVRDSLAPARYAFRTPDPKTHVVSAGDGVIRTWGYWTRDPYYGSRGTYFADVDGDRAVDAIALNDDGVYVRRSCYVRPARICFAICP